MSTDYNEEDIALRLPTGEVILKNGKAIKPVAIPSNAAAIGQEISSARNAQRTLSRIHRKLGDLPDSPTKMNPVAVVLMYTMIGLNNEDIAVALSTDVDNVIRLKEMDIYKQFMELFDNATFEDARQNAKHILSRAADKAATVMVEALDSTNSYLALAASRDVLEINNIKQSNEAGKLSGLQIKIVSGEDDKDITISLGAK